MSQEETTKKEKRRMARWLKATLIALGSLAGLTVLTVAVVLWLVFTPSQLTKIVNNLAGRFVTCETHFDRVNLSLFKTFPDAGLTIDKVYVVNPMEGAPSDTVAVIGNLTVGVDVKCFLKEKEVVVHQVLLSDVAANLFVDSTGKANFDIFPHSDDEDTTSGSFSLDSLPNFDLKRVGISNLDAVFHNVKGRMDAEVEDFDLDISGTLRGGRVDATLSLGTDCIALTTADSAGNPSLDALLEDMKLALEAEGNLEEVCGDLKLKVENGRLKTGGTDMVNETLQASKKDLLVLEVPFNADLRNMQFLLTDSRLRITDYALDLSADVRLDPMYVDGVVATDGAWQVEPLLAILPEPFVAWKKGMDLDGKVSLKAFAVGHLSDSTMPLIDATATIDDGRFYMPKALPYKVNRIGADLAAKLDLSKGGRSSATVKSLTAHTRNTDLRVSGRADDLLGDMHIDAALGGSLPLEDARPMIPDSLPLDAKGYADLDLKADFRLSQLSPLDLGKILASGTVKLKNLDVTYDSIHAVAPKLDIALRLPAKEHQGRMADAHIVGGDLKVVMPGMSGTLAEPDISVGVNNPMKEQLAASFEIRMGETEANIDSMMVSLGALELKGSMRMDSTQKNPLRRFNPVADIDLHSAVLYMPLLPDAVRLSRFAVAYNNDMLNIKTADVKMGHSDFQLYGEVENLEKWMSHEGVLIGDLNFTSGYTDADQLMAMFSGMGSDADTLEQMRQEDNVPDDANPFIVPKDVDLTLHTHIRRSVAFGNDLSDVAGALTVKDGSAILDQIGFVCKAATMQLTALYRSPRPNNLFCALDFHLLDIQIDELLDMIPTVDTLVPMLNAFNGNANFHLAGESYLDARYHPKMSTLLGSAAISGRDLVVMDNNSIAQIAKLMQFKSWKDKDDKIRIDSLSVELTCFRKEVEVYPFVLNIGKYQLCASGKHTLDNVCNYHVELLKNPLMAKVGVDVKGPLSSPKISLGEVRYADLYRPERQGVVEQRTLELKRMIREALEKNVR